MEKVNDQQLGLSTDWKLMPSQNLFKLCAKRVAELLLHGYFIVKPSKNPSGVKIGKLNLLRIPGSIIKLLIRLLFCLEYPDVPEETVLRPFLMCYLEEINIRFYSTFKNMMRLNDIFKTLQKHADQVKIISITSNDDYILAARFGFLEHSGMASEISANLSKLISKCKHLEKLKVDFLFDIKVLFKLTNIIDLDLAFLKEHHALHKLSKEPLDSLKNKLIDKLPKLRTFKYTEEEFYDFSNKYSGFHTSLKKPSKTRSLKINRATSNSCKLIERLFPDVRDLYVCLNVHLEEPFSKLENLFKKYILHINGFYETDHNCFFQLYGSQVSELKMSFFSSISQQDFFKLLSLLPNLVVLDVTNICLCKWILEPPILNCILSLPVSKVLNNLKKLTLNFCNDKFGNYEIYKAFLISVLSRCLSLEKLFVKYFRLDDNIMTCIFAVNSFRYLKKISFSCHRITKEFVANMVASVQSLEYIGICEKEYEDFDAQHTWNEVRSIRGFVHKYNPYLNIDFKIY